MKKNYEKPALIFESYDFKETATRGGCGVPGGGTSIGRPAHWSINTCGWDLGNGIVWVDSDRGCDILWGEDDPFEGICYNTPSGNQSIFSS